MGGRLWRAGLASALAGFALVLAVVLRATHSTVFQGPEELLMCTSRVTLNFPPEQPWYEVASSGDGISPESVNIWSIPPTVTTANTFQDPTKWNGDHVLNGGNKEWAEEDAALHAFNMENWRSKIMETQAERQKSQYRLMNAGGASGKKLQVTPRARRGEVTGLKDFEEDLMRKVKRVLKQAKGSQGGTSTAHLRRKSGNRNLVRNEREDSEDLKGILNLLDRSDRDSRRSGSSSSRNEKLLRLERHNRDMLNKIMHKIGMNGDGKN